MYCMVTLIASCIHVYSFGYMHEELHDVTDPLAKLASGEPLRRPGRFYRFYQFLSLFCFSMLGLVIAGNLAMVFAFWELVGICSYLLIGFYIERKSASNAANKAFIVNRVGDFGMNHRPDGYLDGDGHVLVRRRERPGRPPSAPASSALSARRKASMSRACPMEWSVWRRRGRSRARSNRWPQDSRNRGLRREVRRDWRHSSREQTLDVSPRRQSVRIGTVAPAGLRLLADGRRGAGHFLRLRGQERPVPAARLVARCHGRSHARQRT